MTLTIFNTVAKQDYNVNLFITEDIDTKKQNEISTELKKNMADYKKKCNKIINNNNLGLTEVLADENAGIYKILSELIKKQKNINCCDNVDLSKFVLKSSIPPCSNAIPDKYKDYAQQYKQDGREDEDEYHPLRINDKFSIIFICIIVFTIIVLTITVF